MDDSISFRFVKTNGITLHIAEQGSGPLVLMLHGFPEFWYSWRHQIPVLAKAGYHVVAPDMRGFGKSDIPDGVEKYTVCHIVGDLVGLLDALHIEQAFIIGHDWGAYIAWNLCLLRPDRAKGLVALSVYHSPRSPAPPIEMLRRSLGEGFYMCRFQEPGRAETDFARVGYASVLKKIFFCDKNDLWIASPNQEISDVFDEPSVAPTWISLEEINFYADEFQKTGFTGGLNYYRVLNLNWELLAPWANAKVVTPTLFITGSEDVVYALPGAQDYVKNRMKDFVPNLQGIVVLEGAHHFMHEERPDAVNMLILDSLKGFHKCKL
eukprot:c15376_g1_i2 orf=356-1321(+)